MECYICEKRCHIPDGEQGACGLYQNQGGEIRERFPNKYLTVCPISIETMPILHFYPGGKFLQISTAGCNFNCPGCVSTLIVKEMEHASKALQELSPQEVVAEAQKNNCLGIVFLLNDPLASFLTFLKVARLAKQNHLLVGCSSNTYFSESSLAELSPYLDFINIGVKGLSDEIYRACGAGTVNPVLRNLGTLYRQGVHVEVAFTLQRNNAAEARELAGRIAALSPDIPLQLMRFIPLESADLSWELSIREAESLCRDLRKYLRYVYLFNSPGTDDLHTYCPNCGQVILERDFYGPMGAKLLSPSSGSAAPDSCPQCGWAIPIHGTPAEIRYREGDFQGGYPLTRALEMVEAILITMGVKDKHQVVQVWEDILHHQRLQKLHQDIQQPERYLDLVRYCGGLIQREENAEALIAYMREKLDAVRAPLSELSPRPRVYYAMGKPLFPLEKERMENQLIIAAGGISVNQEIGSAGRPGRRITAAELNALDPEVIFISAFLSSSVEDFYEECYRAGITADAVRHKRIFTPPAPGWDFGSPRWILGLQYIANMLHPDIYHFDVWAEARRFYEQFYGMEFSLSDLNRSFAKPNSKWTWAAL